MRFIQFLLGVGAWTLAWFVDYIGTMSSIPGTGAYTGVFLLFGVGFLFMAVVGPSKSA